MTTTYRAAYLVTADRQGELVLTAPEHAHLSEEELLEEARAEMARIDLEPEPGSTLEVGDWSTGELA